MQNRLGSYKREGLVPFVAFVPLCNATQKQVRKKPSTLCGPEDSSYYILRT